ncbi:MAG: chemical-damaging agent resistance protein C [Alphaproteobacteria bacterium]|nr:chemical-damaging agent resistance protein C [Alphaproteobacteria bacterium]
MADEDIPYKEFIVGDKTDLTRIDPTLRNVMIGVGWDVIGFDDQSPDLDVSVFLLDKNNQTRMDEDFIFYNNPSVMDGTVEHKGDNRTGAGDGDDEIINIDLNKLPLDVLSVSFAISIHEADLRDHSFKKNVRNGFFRIASIDSDREMLRIKLDDMFVHDEKGKATAFVIGTLNRDGPLWSFEIVGKGAKNGLGEIATSYGIQIA